MAGDVWHAVSSRIAIARLKIPSAGMKQADIPLIYFVQ